MGSGNTLPGADRRATPSFSASEDLVDEFDDWVNASTDYDSRSEALCELMTDAIGGQPRDDLTPLQPPTEQPLADAYRRLCRSGYPGGQVRDGVAKRVAVRNHPHNLSTSDAVPVILSELRDRGYLRRRSAHPAQNTPLAIWEIIGWNNDE